MTKCAHKCTPFWGQKGPKKRAKKASWAKIEEKMKSNELNWGVWGQMRKMTNGSYCKRTIELVSWGEVKKVDFWG